MTQECPPEVQNHFREGKSVRKQRIWCIQSAQPTQLRVDADNAIQTLLVETTHVLHLELHKLLELFFPSTHNPVRLVNSLCCSFGAKPRVTGEAMGRSQR